MNSSITNSKSNVSVIPNLNNYTDLVDLVCEIVKPEPEFPNDLFTLEQRRHGAIILHILAAAYIITEHICDEYFMPSIECLSFEKLKLSPHVAGATLLAASSSFTEFCTSLVGVFFAKNDISLNTLLGSGSYNLLVITSICCFCVYKLNIKLIKYPVIRDSIFYSINLLLIYFYLIKNNYNRLHWYDSLISVCVYVFFIIINILDAKIFNFIRDCYTCNLCKKKEAKYSKARTEDPNLKSANIQETNIDTVIVNSQSCNGVQVKLSDGINKIEDFDGSSISSKSSGGFEEPYDMFKAYKNFKKLKLMKQIKLAILLPARLIAFVFILDFRRFEGKVRNLVLSITLLTSLGLIGCCSYVFIWMILVICETSGISETLLGFTIVAAATSMEETITSISICKREIKRYKQNKEGESKLNMAISNCIGSNIFDLSIGIGIPYLFNSLFFTQGRYFTKVYSGNITFITFGLLVCLLFYLTLLTVFKWELTKYFGLSLLSIWLIYNIMVVCLELNLVKLEFFNFGIKPC